MIPETLEAVNRESWHQTAILVTLATLPRLGDGKQCFSRGAIHHAHDGRSRVLRPVETAGFAILCSYIRSWFDVPGSTADLILRIRFCSVAYFVSVYSSLAGKEPSAGRSSSWTRSA